MVTQMAFAWNGDQGGGQLRPLRLDRRVAWRPPHHRRPCTRRQSELVSRTAGRSRSSAHRPTERAGRVYVMSPLGGGERKVSDFGVTVADDPIAAPFGQISWSSDGRYIAAARAIAAPGSSENTGIYLIPTQGGEPRPLTHATAPAAHRDPALSPDGRRLAYFACSNCCYAACDVMTVDLDARAPHVPVRHDGSPRWPQQMYGLAWTRDGQGLVFGARPRSLRHHLWRVNSDGHTSTGTPRSGWSWRPQAGHRPVTRSAGVRATNPQSGHLSVQPTAPPRPAIVSSSADFNASFSPDGTRIVYASSRSGDRADIWVAAADGSGRPAAHGGDAAAFTPRRGGLPMVASSCSPHAALTASLISGPSTRTAAIDARSPKVPASRGIRAGPGTARGSTSPKSRAPAPNIWRIRRHWWARRAGDTWGRSDRIRVGGRQEPGLQAAMGSERNTAADRAAHWRHQSTAP